MKKQIFAFDEHNYHECQSGLRGENNQEYYSGEFIIEESSVIDVRADGKTVGTSSIIFPQSKSRLFFQRSWHPISEDAAHVTVLRFIKRGSLHISHQSGNNIAHAGQFWINKSLSP